MPSIGKTWFLASIGAVVEMGILSTLKRLLMESMTTRDKAVGSGVCIDISFMSNSLFDLSRKRHSGITLYLQL
jgi:hypothetical protein